ncbi:EF-hand calcium-binding domain-containing protein 2-like isoform X2 [Fopius arisanus]|uniref:EF-hand calcium-binding domain-containing protein 2-like isoform X2 n=1 Tax=Fopius arisanus TaxID=64838 RepID=A0A9R1T4R8_9HYME|nr:PREDICTED: EF-hand calcium-binding domain-containing protein 2-like isoform X2 [Fopius arisanus]
MSGSLEPSLLEKRISDAFDVFDNARSHEVDVRELGTIIRSLGCVISEAELQEIQVQVEDVENNCVTQGRFVEYMSKAICEQKFKPADPEDLLRAFQFLDGRNNGYIMRADLEKAMMEIGEPFAKEEIDEMMSVACDPTTMKINYEHYINLLIPKIPGEDDIYLISEAIEAAKIAAAPKKNIFFKDLT